MDSKIKSSPLTLRRLRQNSHVRALTRQHRVSVEQLIQPHFVVEGLKDRQAIPGLTGVYRENTETLLKQIESDLKVGANKLLLFPVPAEKAQAQFPQSKLSQSQYDFASDQIAAIKKRFGNDLWLSVDVCLCSTTNHGHCGILNEAGDHLDNGSTVSELARAAAQYAQAGADCVAPSDMMDGRIGAIREALDAKQDEKTLVMSYAAKFHSKFYGPFRLAADSAPKGENRLKDRATYQIDPGNFKDALASALRDEQEGADILMVKPGLPYLDILQSLSQEILKPWAVYEVSGEYASVELMAKEGLIAGPEAHLEAWTAFVRSGASMIITYGARNAQEWLKRL